MTYEEAKKLIDDNGDVFYKIYKGNTISKMIIVPNDFKSQLKIRQMIFANRDYSEMLKNAIDFDVMVLLNHGENIKPNYLETILLQKLLHELQ